MTKPWRNITTIWSDKKNCVFVFISVNLTGDSTIVVLAMTIVMAILTIRPVAARKNIKVRDNFKLKRRYANSQKLFYLKPKKRGELNAFEEEQNRQ